MAADPLNEWSRLTNENTVHELVSAAYSGVLSNVARIDAFSTWLLAGTGATAALLVTNIQSITEALSPSGFKVCFILLTLSALAGLVAKSISVFFPASPEAQAALQARMAEIFERHAATRKEIEASAEAQGRDEPQDLSLDDFVQEFLKPLPRVARWFISRFLVKKLQHRQAGYHIPLRSFMWQSNACALQVLLFLAFMASVAWFA